MFELILTLVDLAEIAGGDSSTYAVIWVLGGIFFAFLSIFISYKLVKYGVKNDSILALVVAFFVSPIFAILFWIILTERKRAKNKQVTEKNNN